MSEQAKKAIEYLLGISASFTAIGANAAVAVIRDVADGIIAWETRNELA